MSGGKETPRQKMIGMMYLVLTALLALNVSKSILDAFVAIEENTQKGNIVQFFRGTNFISDVNSEIGSSEKDAENKAKLDKLKFVYKKMEAIDVEASNMIKEIDELKIEILKESGENVEVTKDKDEELILWTKSDAATPSLPMRMNLMAVQAKDQYDIPMHVIIGEDIKNPSGKGITLWNNFNNYRNRLVEMIGSYDMNGKKFVVKNLKAINEFDSNMDLQNKVEAMIKGMKNINKNEDEQAMIELYIMMTKKEKGEVHGVKGVHWIGQTFDHSPLVAALASLSSLQQDVLSARAFALNHWKSKVSTGEYSFNKVMPLAYGPVVANSGDSITLQVMMAAFDSDNQPVVTVEGMEGVNITYPGNGQGLVKLTAGGTTMSLKGTVAIRKKSGAIKKENWEHEIIIMKPSGSIELPEMNMLYRGYANKVQATASGYDQTSLGGTGVSITKNGSEGWIVKPTGRSREAYLTVTGKNSATGQSKQLKRVKYRVSNLPAPDIFWGGAASGTKASKRETRLFAKYPPEIPLNATFRIVSWECTVPGAPGRPPRGTGSNISSATSLIMQARPGTTITFMTKVVGPDGVQRKRVGAFKI